MTVDIGANEIGTDSVLGEMFYFDGLFTFLLEMVWICGSANNEVSNPVSLTVNQGANLQADLISLGYCW